MPEEAHRPSTVHTALPARFRRSRGAGADGSKTLRRARMEHILDRVGLQKDGERRHAPLPPYVKTDLTPVQGLDKRPMTSNAPAPRRLRQAVRPSTVNPALTRKPRPPPRLVFTPKSTTRQPQPAAPELPVVSPRVPSPPPAVLAPVAEAVVRKRPAQPKTSTQRVERRVERWRCVCGGGDSTLIRVVLSSRSRWELQEQQPLLQELAAPAPAAGLLWVPSSLSVRWAERRAASVMGPPGGHQGKQLVSAFEEDVQLLSVAQLWHNLTDFCLQRRLGTERYMPPAVHIQGLQDIQALEGSAWVLRSSDSAYSKVECICSTMRQISSQVLAADRAGHALLAQRYEEDTVLVDGRKIDLRCFVLVDTSLEAWMHRHPFYTMAAQPCDQSTPYTDRAARCPSHAADAPLDCFPLPQLERHLEAQGGTAGVVAGSVVPQMSEVVADVISAVKHRLTQGLCGEANCFQVFEFRFVLLSAGFVVKLVSVQSEDILHTRSAVHCDIVPRLLEDIYAAVVDPVFPPHPGLPSRPVTSSGSKGDLVKLVLRRPASREPTGRWFAGGTRA